MSWTTKRLEEVADFTLGKMLDQRKNRGEPFPYLANVNVRWGTFELDDLRIMKFEHHEMERYSLNYGDIVMCEGGEPGRCAIWKAQQPGMMFQKALHRIRPHSGLDAYFLFYFFLLTGKTGGFAPYFTGSTIKHLPREKLARIEISIPPLPIQQRIASVLSTYDELITANCRRIALLEESARLLYREWFVNLRFPGKNPRLEKSPTLPNGWQYQSLSAVAELNRSSLNVKNSPETIRYLDISSVEKGRIKEPSEISFSEAPGRARRLVTHGDIIWSCVRPERRSYALIWEPTPNLVVSTGFSVVSAIKIPFTFLYLSITTADFVDYLKGRATGAAYPAVTAKDFESASILIPDEETLNLFDDACRPTLEMINCLHKQNKKLMEARDALLPKLMSGALLL